MNIKKNLRIITLFSLLAFIVPSYSNALNMPSDSTQDSKIALQIIQRVTEIQNMDKTNLTPSEKSELKKELRQMKHKADGLDRRVYLSIGAIIIIILLLILIL
jgi:phage-related protein